MKTSQIYAEKASNDHAFPEDIDEMIAHVTASLALARARDSALHDVTDTRIVLLKRVIDLQDICSEVGLPLSHVPENSERSIRENIRWILKQASLSASESHVPGLVDGIEEATQDLLHVDRDVMKYKRKAASDHSIPVSPAAALRAAAMEALRSGLNSQAVDWNREDIEELRQIRIALCRLSKDDFEPLQGTYNKATGLEVLGEDNRGRQLVVVVREPEKAEKKLAVAKPNKGKG